MSIKDFHPVWRSGPKKGQPIAKAEREKMTPLEYLAAVWRRQPNGKPSDPEFYEILARLSKGYRQSGPTPAGQVWPPPKPAAPAPSVELPPDEQPGFWQP